MDKSFINIRYDDRQYHIEICEVSPNETFRYCFTIGLTDTLDEARLAAEMVKSQLRKPHLRIRLDLDSLN